MDTNRPTENEPMLRQALAIAEASYGPNHPEVATGLTNLAGLLFATKRMAEAEPLLRRALTIFETTLGADHPDVVPAADKPGGVAADHQPPGRGRAAVSAGTGDRRGVARPRPPRRRPRPQQPGGDASDQQPPDRGRAALPESGGDLGEVARPGSSPNRHNSQQPCVGASENQPPGRCRAAVPPGAAIDEASYGPNHLNVAFRLNNLAGLLLMTNRLAEAEPLSRRMLEILLQSARATGQQHPHLSSSANNHARILRAMGLGPEDVRDRLNALGRPFGISLGG